MCRAPLGSDPPEQDRVRGIADRRYRLSGGKSVWHRVRRWGAPLFTVLRQSVLRLAGLVVPGLETRIRVFAGAAPPTGGRARWTSFGYYLTDPPQSTPELIDLAVHAIQHAWEHPVHELAERARLISSPFERWGNLFPGEHYRILAGLTALWDPTTILDVGTFTGASALTFLEASRPGARVITYDLVPW